MYNNPYISNYPNFNQQNINDRIDNQIAQLQQMKEQMKQPMQQPSINQTFQLSSNQNGIKYADTIDDVNKELVFAETPFFTRDFSQMWLKNAKGDIKVFTLVEIVPKDEKDLMISSLQMQIEELRKEIKQNAKPNDTDVNEPNTNEKPTNVSVSRTSTKKSK